MKSKEEIKERGNEKIPVFYKKSEVAKMLRCSRTEITRMILSGELVYDYKRGATVLFTEKTIHNYLESIKVKI
jgi:excisionase family DNA binding protein